VSDPREAAFGTWASSVSAQMLATAAIDLGEPWLENGVAWWLEERPAEEGRAVIVRSDPWSEPADVTPAGFNVRTKVHEYGGGSFVVHDGVVWFSNFADQRLYRQDPGGVPRAITPDTGGRHRYADGRVTPDGSVLICVRERHLDDGVVNELVALATDGSTEPLVIEGGRDFYAAPRLSPDGARLAWLTWDLPWMPWDGCELWTAEVPAAAELAAGAPLGQARKVAGTCGEESIWQPGWSPAGDLHFVSDRTGWWNLYRERGGETDALCPMEAEFGWPHWVFGGSSFAFLEDGRVVCLYGHEGVQHVAVLDPTSGELIDLDLPYTAISYPHIVAEGSRALFIAGGPTMPTQLASLDFTSRAVDVLREAETVTVDAGHLSVSRAIEFPTDGGLTAFAHFYPPVNRDFVAPQGERPPLIVMSHGGPTSERTAELDMSKQFWTSRGFAVVDVNYGGSTGHGRAYRLRLNGTWGVTDTNDCINAARYLAGEGLVDGSRFVIRGGSAGGYTTLCALTMHDDFAAGASYYGLSDLEPFAQPGGTHKFECRYTDTLIGPYPEFAETFRERSPIHFVENITTPMLVLQGAEDEVVPPAQAEVIVEALEARTLPYAYLLFEGEQHGFRKADTIRTAYEAELSFYAQILGFTPAGDIPKLKILHL
jgi:dipeptidyl aminopeptidase/acylaminoacyl peptidase